MGIPRSKYEQMIAMIPMMVKEFEKPEVVVGTLAKECLVLCKKVAGQRMGMGEVTNEDLVGPILAAAVMAAGYKVWREHGEEAARLCIEKEVDELRRVFGVELEDERLH